VSYHYFILRKACKGTYSKYTMSQKGTILTMTVISSFVDRFAKSFSLLQRALNVQQNQLRTHHTLAYLCYCITLENLQVRNFALLTHIKHVSNVTFYDLSNRYLPNVMKISAKFTPCKISAFYFLFVYCP